MTYKYIKQQYERNNKRKCMKLRIHNMDTSRKKCSTVLPDLKNLIKT